MKKALCSGDGHCSCRSLQSSHLLLFIVAALLFLEAGWPASMYQQCSFRWPYVWFSYLSCTSENVFVPSLHKVNSLSAHSPARFMLQTTLGNSIKFGTASGNANSCDRNLEEGVWINDRIKGCHSSFVSKDSLSFKRSFKDILSTLLSFELCSYTDFPYNKFPLKSALLISYARPLFYLATCIICP